MSGKPSAADRPFLTIAMATMQDRIDRIDLDRLPQDRRWRYAIVCQYPEETGIAQIENWAAEAMRRRVDIAVTAMAGSGVARSRNAALDACDTEVLLFTDDDVRLLPAGISSVISAFQRDRSLGLFAGRTLLEDGQLAKRYPARPQRLTRFNSARIGTVELAVRPRLVRDKGVWFDVNFGAGAPHRLGDEYVFVTDCLKAGLEGLYEPVPIAVHFGASSGFGFAGTAEDRARVFERVFPPGGVPFVKLAFLLRHWRRLGPPASAWRFTREFLRPHVN